MQISASRRLRRGMRWSPKHIQFALQLYFKSPTSYRFLMNTFYLPSISVLKRRLSDLMKNPGLCEYTLESLKVKVCSMSMKVRFAVLSYDAMSIKEAWSYNETDDIIYGFENYPAMHNQCSVKSADQILVLMVNDVKSR